MRARLLLLAGALAAFGASLGSGFHFDDYAIFSEPALRSPTGFLEIWKLRQTRPLTYLTYWLNFAFGERNPLGYHLLNLLLHLAVVLLVYECLRRLMTPQAAAIAAALFAVHPLQAESVDYVWGRSILLATLFCCASLWSWLEERQWIAVLWFGLALLAKEECAAFPLVLLLLSRKREEMRRVLPPILTMLLLSVAAGARVIYATAVTPGAPAGFQAGITPAKYLLAQGVVILRYLQLAIVPYGFTVDPDLQVPAVWSGVLAWAAVLALAAAAWRYARDGGGLWFVAGLILLIPSSSVFPAADLAADRRMYLPLVAFAAAAALLLDRVEVPAVAIGCIVVYALVGIDRTMVWRSDQTLWREAVRRAPDKVRPKIQLARSLPAAAALEVLGRARTLAPNDPAIAAETGKTLLTEGQPDAALSEFGRALALDPRDARNFNNRGVALEALGQTAAARADFERALEIDPDLTEARENLRKLTER